MKKTKSKAKVTIKPTKCHLWSKDPLEWEDMSSFIELERYINESHLIRKLCKCTDCSQLYYYEFYETIDWEKGEDPQYRMYIPIADKRVVVALNKLSNIEILRHTPRLLFDWKDEKTVRWIK